MFDRNDDGEIEISLHSYTIEPLPWSGVKKRYGPGITSFHFGNDFKIVKHDETDTKIKLKSKGSIDESEFYQSLVIYFDENNSSRNLLESIYSVSIERRYIGDLPKGVLLRTAKRTCHLSGEAEVK